MGWLTRWFDRRVALDDGQRQRLAAWQALPRQAPEQPFNATRCVVVDVETSGLNLMEDRLISIGAVAVVNGKVALGDSFYVVLQQATVSDKPNILLHGIGAAAQAEGKPAADALLDFLEFLGRDPLVAFHVTFDRTMIQRALRQFLGLNLRHDWADLAYLMPALNPALAASHRSLDDWADRFGIGNEARHNALADALVTAQLLQIGFFQCGARNIENFAGLRDLEEAQRWVSTPA